MPKPFAVVVLQHHRVRLVGVSINTNLQQAPVDCPQLWNNVFNARKPELSGKPAQLYQGPSYGVSVFTDHEGLAFDYWAAMEAPGVAALPSGMSEVTLPGGLYACCRIPAPGMLREAYDYMYDEWPNSPEGFAVQLDKPCFERYDSRFVQSGTHDVYVPVLPNQP